MNRIAFIVTLFSLVTFAAPARADIYQWEYINPADPSQGKRQSTTLAPDGAGVDAVPGANLGDRDLTMAYLIGADLTNAWGYQANLTNADLSQANLTNAVFYLSMLTGVNICGAEVRRANFGRYSYYEGTGVTPAQLYSTASYQAHDLTGIGLQTNDLSGGNFAGQNLSNADLGGAYLAGANFRQANLANAKFVILPSPVCGVGLGFGCSRVYATLADADLTVADARGADLHLHPYLADAITTNLIQPDGRIHGLDLQDGDVLVVRDYDARSGYRGPIPPIPITIDQHLAMGPGGTLRIVFEADAWDSTISFAPDIPVTLGGTLELTFADDINPATQLGRTLKIFDWTGVDPTGAFTVSSPYRWDLSSLYTTGQVTFTAIPEPASIALVAAAFSVVMLWRGRWWHKL